jgi:UDP-glucose 4-epimerase
MRIVVVGATGNVGTSLLRALARRADAEVTAVARRLPDESARKAFRVSDWVRADIAEDDLVPIFRGADVVIHLAWLIQPSRDTATLQRVNVGGSERLFRAVAEANVPALVYASSVGAYSPNPGNERVTEDWPTRGIRSSYYSTQKASVEALLDRLEAEEPGLRVVRLRPALVFKREAATGIRRLFMGPFLFGPMLSLPLMPTVDGLRFQCVHADDLAAAYVSAAVGDARGPFNIASEPVLDACAHARARDARCVALPAGLARTAVSLAWHARAVSISPDWLDLGLNAPLLDTAAARTALGWEPTVPAERALAELLDGIRHHEDGPTPPLARETSGVARWRELVTRLGGRDDTRRRSSPT